MLAIASDLLVFLRSPLFGFLCALGLADEVKLLSSLGDESPARVVGVNRLIDPERARQLDVLVVIQVVGVPFLVLGFV